MEMKVALTQAGLYISKFRASGKDPYFFARQGKAPGESLQNLAGSLGHVTASLGTLCVELLCRKQGKFIFLDEKSLEMANVGAGEKPCRGVGERNEIKLTTSLKVMDF